MTALADTRVSLSGDEPRARVDLVVGYLAPRLISRDSTSAVVALAAAQMLLLDGDEVHMQIEVGPGCTLELLDVGGTVAYPGATEWRVSVALGAGARLIWAGLPFIVTAGAQSRRRTSISLAKGAVAVIRETLVLGRHHETGGSLDSRFTAVAPEGPLLVEHLEVHGKRGDPGVLGPARIADTVMALGFRPPTRAGDLVLDKPGAVARYLGIHHHESPLDGVLDDWAGFARRL